MKNPVTRAAKFIRRNKAFTKLICLVLSLVLTFYVIPSTIYAKAAELFDSEDTDDALSAENASGAPVTNNGSASSILYNSPSYEIKELREENVKHFRLADGTSVAAQYSSAVHYADEDGAWQDIDNSLFESGNDISTGDAKIKFSKKITGNSSLFTLHDGNTKITVSLVGAIKGTSGTVTNGEDAEDLTELQKMMNLEKLSSSVIYEDILEGTDLEYIVSASQIKENIIVKEPLDVYSYTFEIRLNGLVPELTADGNILITEEGTEVVKYEIPAPVVYDANYSICPQNMAAYTLSAKGNGKYLLTVNVSTGWANDDSVAFPITIDPVIVNPSTAYGVVDTYVSELNPNTRYDTQGFLNTRNGHFAYWKCGSLPSIPQWAYITDAYITIGSFNHLEGQYTAAYEVISQWDETLTWNDTVSETNPRGERSSEVMDYIEAVSAVYFSWNITEAVRRWYQGHNYGIAFGAVDGFSNNMILYSSDNSNSSARPTLVVNYRDIKGIESYWSYSSHSAGVAGTGSVNLANGDLVFTIPTLTATDSIFSYTPTLVYNSSMRGTFYSSVTAYSVNPSIYTAKGFKLSIEESLIEKQYTDADGSSVTYYVYADGDGTEHFFYSHEIDTNGDYQTDEVIIRDADGLGLELEISGESAYITDRNKTVRHFKEILMSNLDFTRGWMIDDITDASGNKLIFTRNDFFLPTEIRLLPNGETTEIHLLTLLYSSDDALIAVYNPTSHDSVILRYTAAYNSYDYVTEDCNCLSAVEYCTGESTTCEQDVYVYACDHTDKQGLYTYASASYFYDSSGRITLAANDATRGGISYEWNYSSVVAVNEYFDQEIGQTVRYTYGHNYTEARSSGSDDAIDTDDDIITRYVFDQSMRSVGVYSHLADNSELLGMTTGIYESDELVANHLKQQTVTGGNPVNYILNGDFEARNGAYNIYHWYMYGNASGSSNLLPDTMGGNKSVRIEPRNGVTAGISQYVRLSEGAYTLSFKYSSEECENCSAYVKVISTADSGLEHIKEISINKDTGNSAENTFSTTFNVGSGGDDLKISIEMTGSNATEGHLLVDMVNLQKGIGATDFCIVEYGSFDATVSDSNGNIKPIGDFWSYNDSNTAPTIVDSSDPVFGNSVQISDGYVKQRIYEAGDDVLCEFGGSGFYSNAGCTYIVSAFAKTADSFTSGNAPFQIKVEVHYYQGEDKDDVTETFTFDFLPDCDTWQLVSGTFDTINEYDPNAVESYSCVRAIDIYCVYENHIYPALFDNISVKNSSEKEVTNYYYYNEGTSAGLLAMKATPNNYECYEYDENGNLSRVANTYGALTDYTYQNNLLQCAVSYTFSYGSTHYYPWYEDNPDALITKTVKNMVRYTYNSYGLVTKVESLIVDDALQVKADEKQVVTDYEYITTAGSAFFGAPVRETDSLGVSVRYFYNERGSILASVNESTGDGIAYTYNEFGRLTGVSPASYVSTDSSYSVLTNSANVEYTYNYADLISTITTESTTYTFLYNEFEAAESVKIGDTEISSYEYNDHNGKLKKITYANGLVTEYEYNPLEMLEKVWYTKDGVRTLAYEYEYTASGQIYKLVDHISGTSYIYSYDSRDRLVSYSEYRNDEHNHYHTTTYQYNDSDQLWRTMTYLSYAAGDEIYSSYYSRSRFYNTEGNIISDSISTGDGWHSVTSYRYDSFGRLSEITRDYGDDDNYVNSISYTYLGVGTRTSALVSSYVSSVNGVISESASYTYDDNGNIIEIDHGSGYDVTYSYDELGQLIREQNERTGYMYTYTYDDAGNILKCTIAPLLTSDDGLEIMQTGIGADASVNVAILPSVVSKVYSYTNTAWGDQLTSYDGHTITYDALGNPLTYYNGASYTFTWSGRRMTSATKGGLTYTFTYNDEGLRTSKTVNGVTTYYYYEGTLLVAEQSELKTIVYLYDSIGAPIGFRYRTPSYAEDVWDDYYYEKNMQGDIVRVYNSDGVSLVSYVYTAWGEITSTTYHNSGANTTVTNNPFRYRGYYYDRDLGLYCTSTRYYDSNIGRWISPDSVMSGVGGDISGYNLYAYCFNNPVMYSDHTGCWPSWVEKVAIAVAIVAVVATVAAITVSTAGAGTAAAVIAVSAAKGAAAGMVTGAAIGAAAGAINHRATTGSWEGAGDAALNGMADGALSGAITGAVTGAISGGLKHYSQSTTRLYRSVSESEANNFSNTGILSAGEGQMEGKFFATTKQHAKLWGAELGSNRIISIKVPTSALQHSSVSYFPRLDAIGPAYYFSDLSYLNSIVI